MAVCAKCGGDLAGRWKYWFQDGSVKQSVGHGSVVGYHHQCDSVAPPVTQPSLGSHHQCMSAVQRGDAHAWDSATWQALCPRHAQEHLLERIRTQDILIRSQADRIRVLEEMLQAQDTNTQEIKPDVKRARRA